MKCRCGHGRSQHGYTAAGLRYARKHGTLARQPCHGHDYEPYSRTVRGVVIAGVAQDATVSGNRFIPCKCRNWHPEEVIA